MAQPNELATMVDLNISCKDLPKLDVTSKSDPMVVVYQRDANNQYWDEIGRTELIKNDSNPKFTTPVSIKYYFEELQLLRFLVVDVDDPKEKIEKGSDYIGEAMCSLGDIVGSVGNQFSKTLTNEKHKNRKNGEISIRGTETGNSNEIVRFRLSGVKLDKKDFLSKSDPFVIIHKSDGQNGFIPIHKTEVIKNTLDPAWKVFELPLGRLCGNNYELPLMIECWDWDSDGGHDLIGKFTTTLREMQDKRSFELIEPKIQKKKGSKYKNSGILKIDSLDIVKKPTFLEYISGGTEINLIVGIDFTGSNGNPSSPSSLHYRNPNGPNEYMVAIRTVGDIVAAYDHDKWFPAFGFGGYLNGDTSHCFALNGNEQNPNCAGIDGVLQSYVNSFNFVQLSGPTNFAPIINRVIKFAEQVKYGEKYYILLMITDGAITDMNNTISALRKAANLPISVIIVGVGGANFSNMNVLDDDDGNLNFQRDVVQFVPLRNYPSNQISKLAKDTLAEVPSQLVKYMLQHNIQPRPMPTPHY